MSFNLRRIGDNAGDSGGSSQSFKFVDNKIIADGDYPKVGNYIKVGSLIARTYSRQDWWCTTKITKILNEIKNDDTFYIKFKTTNSTYEWWSGKYPSL